MNKTIEAAWRDGFLNPDDVAKAVRSVIDGDWPFSPGAVIHVDGGLTLGRL